MTKLARSLVVLMTLLLPAVLLACGGSIVPIGGGGGDASADGHSRTDAGADRSTDADTKTDGCGRTLAAVQVAPTRPSIASGTTQQFTATGISCDGTGLAKGLKIGTATIRAASGPVTSEATLTVIETGPPSLQVSPPTANTTVGGVSVAFTATRNFIGMPSMDLTTLSAWTSSDPTIATVGASTGIAIPVKNGFVTISASYMGRTGTAKLNVGSCGFVGIAVTPATHSLAVGLTQQFTATEVFCDGTTANVTASASWTSSSSVIATISSTGLATGVSAGTSTIAATAGTVSGSVVLTVGGGCTGVEALSVTPNPASGVAGGASVPFTATWLCSGIASDVTSKAAWATSAPAVATVGAGTGLAFPLSVGTPIISATYDVVTGTASLNVGP